MDKRIYRDLQAAFAFSDSEFSKWEKIFNHATHSESFLNFAGATFLLPHYNAAADFIARFMGSYEKSSYIQTSKSIELSFFTPSFSGECGISLYLDRHVIEVRKLVNQDGKQLRLRASTIAVA